jgi:hypothetical protein
MAKFCIKCGKPLAIGEICACIRTETSPEKSAQADSTINQSQANAETGCVTPAATISVPNYVMQEPPAYAKAYAQEYTYIKSSVKEPPPYALYETGTPQANSPYFEPLAQIVEDSPDEIAQKPIVQGTAFTPVNYLSRLVKVTVSIFKTPATMLQRFVAAQDYQVAVAYIVILALSIAGFMAVFFHQVNASFIEYTIQYDVISTLDANTAFPLGTIFVLTLACSIGLSALFAAVLLLLNRVMMKAETNFPQMLCVAGAKCIAAVPFVLAGMGVAFFSIKAAVILACLGLPLSYVFVAAALKSISAQEENKAAHILFLSFAVITIATVFAVRLLFPLCIPKIFATLFGPVDYSSISWIVFINYLFQ